MTKIRKYIAGAIPVLTLGLGFMIGRDYDNSSKIETREVELSSSNGKTSFQGEKGIDSKIYRPSLESNGKNITNETIKVLQGNQKTLEEKILKYDVENKTLKSELTKLRHDAGIYDFSDLKEPIEITLEERFARSPAYYLGNFDKKYEDILSMVNIAIKAQKNVHNRGFFGGGKDPSAAIDFYNFGELTMIKDADRPGQYFVDIELKNELVDFEPFMNSQRSSQIGITVDKVVDENGAAELFTLDLQSEIHNIRISYDAKEMKGYEIITFRKIELPILEEENKKYESVPRSITLANSIIEGIELVLKDNK